MGDRRAQAWGFVSRMMVRREGGGSVGCVSGCLDKTRRDWEDLKLQEGLPSEDFS